MTKQWAGFAAALMLAGLPACHRQARTPLPQPIHITDLARPLSSAVEYASVLKPQVTPESALGSVTHAITDASTGDVILVDRDSTRLVYRFDAGGRLRTRYGVGRDGHSRFPVLLDAVVLSNSDVVIFTDRTLAQFDRNGSIKREVPIDFIPNSPVVLRDTIYVRAIHRTPHTGGPYSIVAIGSDLTERRRFHPRDARVDKYAYTGRNSLAVVREELVVADVYEPTVTRYDADGNVRAVLRLPADDDTSAGLWTKAPLSEDDRKRIRTNTHRFAGLFGIGERLFLFESYGRRELARWGVLSLLTGDLSVFSRAPFAAAGPSSDTLPVSAIVGGYEAGLIAVVNSPEHIRADGGVMARHFGVTLTDRDNPMLVFLRLKDVELHSPNARRAP